VKKKEEKERKFIFSFFLSKELVYWLVLRSGSISIFKSTENILNVLGVAVMPDPSALGLTKMQDLRVLGLAATPTSSDLSLKSIPDPNTLSLVGMQDPSLSR